MLQGAPTEAHIREAAWVARTVGRRETAPLSERDLHALAAYISPAEFAPGEMVFPADRPLEALCIVRSGLLELTVGSGRHRVVVELLRPGEVAGDVHLMLDVAPTYSGRAIDASECLMIDRGSFDRLLAENSAIARRWLSSLAERLWQGHHRILELLGASLPTRLARLLLDEARGDVVPLPQRTLAAMLAGSRPAVNKILREFEANRLVELGYREVRLRDRPGLERVARG